MIAMPGKQVRRPEFGTCCTVRSSPPEEVSQRRDDRPRNDRLQPEDSGWSGIGEEWVGYSFAGKTWAGLLRSRWDDRSLEVCSQRTRLLRCGLIDVPREANHSRHAHKRQYSEWVYFARSFARHAGHDRACRLLGCCRHPAELAASVRDADGNAIGLIDALAAKLAVGMLSWRALRQPIRCRHRHAK